MDKFEKEAQRMRKDILRVYGKPIEYNTDCDGLAADIVAKTQRRISASTLKRLFGFVKRTSNFSKHTFDSLSRYVGFESWLDYINVGKQSIETPFSNELWTSISGGAFRITEYNLQTIKECAKVDAGGVVSRKFAEDRLIEFMDSDKLATTFIAPGGYGKSVISAMLTEKFFLDQDKSNAYRDDLVWLVDGGNMSNMITDQKRLKTWVYEQMGYDSERDLLTVLHSNPQYRLGRLVIVVDGFTEVNIKADSLVVIVENLMRALSVIVGIDWFKIVVTCRPNTWFKVVEKIGTNTSLKNAWFDTVFSTDFEEVINVPLLEPSEIQQLTQGYSESITYEKIRFSNLDIEEELRFPYFLQLYLKSDKDPLRLCEVDLYRQYVENVIMGGSFGEDKITLVNEMIAQTNYGLAGNTIDSNDVKDIIAAKKAAFDELLSYGIIFEKKTVQKYLSFSKEMKFAQPKLFEFLVINLWLREKELNFELFVEMEKFYTGSPLYDAMMKWFLRYALYESNTSLVLDIFGFIAPLMESHPEYRTAPSTIPFFNFVAIVATEIRKNPDIKKDLVPKLAASPSGRKLFFELFDDIDNLALTGNVGKDYPDHYIDNSTSLADTIFGRSRKFMKYFLVGDYRRAKKEIDFLREETTGDLPPMQLGMSYACQILADAFFDPVSIKQFEKDILIYGNDLAKSESAKTDFPYYQYLTIDAYNLCGKHYEALKMMKKIKNPYTNMGAYDNHIYSQMLALYHANALLQMKDDKKYIEQAYEILENFEKNVLPNLPINGRLYYRLRYYKVKLDFLDYEERYDDRLALIKELREIAEQVKFTFFDEEAKKVKKENRAKLQEMAAADATDED